MSEDELKQAAKYLLLCPFCGGTPYYTRSVNGTNMHRIGCSACGVYFKAAEVYAPGGTEVTRDIAAAWNKRSVANPTIMSDELRQAAERMIKEAQGYRELGGWPDEDPIGLPEDFERVAKAILAHPPITREQIVEAVDQLFTELDGEGDWDTVTSVLFAYRLCRLLGVEKK